LSAPTAADSKPSAKESDGDYSPSKATVAEAGSKVVDSPSKEAGPPVYADSKATGADVIASTDDDVSDAKSYNSSSADNKGSSSK
jgi:hypothetical protein